MDTKRPILTCNRTDTSTREQRKHSFKVNLDFTYSISVFRFSLYSATGHQRTPYGTRSEQKNWDNQFTDNTSCSPKSDNLESPGKQIFVGKKHPCQHKCLLSTTSTSLKEHPCVRYLTVSACPWVSGDTNHFFFRVHSLPFGKVTHSL
jgi:hypothetical protein